MVTRFLSRILLFAAIEGRPLMSRRVLSSSSTSSFCTTTSKQYSTTSSNQQSIHHNMLHGSSSSLSKKRMEEDLEQVFAYHQETKHQLERYAKGPGMMDWSNQPNPFREYIGSQIIPLELTNIHESYPTMNDLFSGSIQPKQVNFASISQLFRDSLSLSSWKSFRGNKWALRCNPSSGNLHPTEGFLIAGPIEGLLSKGGVYHYRPKDHALEQRTEFDKQDIWSTIVSNLASPNSFFIGLSSIHWREAWKYGERAFRYCQHDVGHAIEAINIAAGTLGWHVHLLDDVVTSQDLFHLFGLEQQQGLSKSLAHEEPDCLLLVTPANSSIPRFEFKRAFLEPLIDASKSSFKWSGTPNKLSRAIVEWNRIDEVCEATRKWTSSASQLLRNSIDGTKNQLKSDVNPPARRIIHQRRSAVDFDPDHEHPMQFSAFLNILRAVQHPFSVLPWSPQVHLAMFVHSVEGLAPGLYFLVRDLDKLQELKTEVAPGYEWTKPFNCPEDIHLYQLALDDSREIAKAISCHQDIASDSSFSLGMIARFENSIQEKGPWFYRRLFWETGMIGQRLYLQAESVGGGFRGTGIGCFFDDVMHSLLGISNYKYQSLYHFTVGFPIVDERLMTLDPYHHLFATTKQS